MTQTNEKAKAHNKESGVEQVEAFLNTGTGYGLGDLSIMVSFFKDSLNKAKEEGRREERERIFKKLKNIPLSYTIRTHEAEDSYESKYIDISDLNFCINMLNIPIEPLTDNCFKCGKEVPKPEDSPKD